MSSCSVKKKEKFDLIILNAQIIDVENNKVSSGKLIGINKDTIQLIADMIQSNNYESDNIIEANNKFIMPGLWDNHVHFRGGDSLIQENKNLLPLYLTYGITTIRDAGGDITPAVINWRNQINSGNLDGPNIFTSGPKLDGSKPAWEGSIKVENIDDVPYALDSLQAIEVDYVKMYDGSLSKEMFYKIIEEAQIRGLKTTGHMPLTANILDAVEHGLDGSEHLYYVLKACSPKADSLSKLNINYGMISTLVDTYDSKLAEKVYKNLAKNKVFITPTLYIGHVLAGLLETDHSNDSLLIYMGAGIQKTYQRRINAAKKAKTASNDSRSKTEKMFSKMVLPMQNAGVNLMAGSDCGAYNSFVYPGESLHSELKHLVMAGLSPQQALITSFINGPKFFNLQEHYGSVSSGKVADLILLDKNPLENIENLSSINIVLTKGTVYEKSALNNMLRKSKQNEN